MKSILQEALIYLIVALGSLLILSYAVHMLVGGLVSEETEILLIALVCVLDIGAMSYMAWDVIQRRRGRRK
jgi:hypothetical protein